MVLKKDFLMFDLKTNFYKIVNKIKKMVTVSA